MAADRLARPDPLETTEEELSLSAPMVCPWRSNGSRIVAALGHESDDLILRLD
ncbi:MAG: hypothetical protein R2932_30720 [Caldilineaceae bacterium]